MAITRPKKAADSFIEAAPDHQKNEQSPPKKVAKRQISLTISPDLLDKVDVMAAETGQSRAGIISMAIYQFTKSEL